MRRRVGHVRRVGGAQAVRRGGHLPRAVYLITRIRHTAPLLLGALAGGLMPVRTIVGQAGDLRKKETAARPCLRNACRRLALSCARDARDVIRCIPSIPWAVWATGRDMVRDVRRRPHAAVKYWNRVPYGGEALAWIMGAGTGLLVPGIGAAVGTVEGVFSLARPRPPTRVLLGLGRRGRAAAEAVVAGYGACGRQGISPAGHLEVGMCLAWLGRHAEALAAYARAGGAEPVGLLPFLIGVSLACLGRHEEARAAHSESLLMAPGLGMARAALEVSAAHPDGPDEDTGGRALVVGLDTAVGARCAQCGRPPGARGHVILGRHGAAWRLCHMRGRRWDVAFRVERAGALALPLAILAMLPFSQDLAVTVMLARAFWPNTAI